MRIFLYFIFSIAIVQNSNASFRKANIISLKTGQLRLYKIDSSPEFNSINYRSLKITYDVPYPESPQQNSISPEGFQLGIDFEFPSLTVQQFNFLKEKYGSGKSVLTFTEGRLYRLSEFLPPVVSAVLGHQFLTEVYQDQNHMIFQETNCWATAYGFHRRENVYTTFLTNERDLYIQNLVDSGFTNVSGSLESIDWSDAKFGDIVLYFVDGVLQHASIHIDQGIWYEKTGNDANTLFRLTDQNDYLEPGHVVYQYYRPTGRLRLENPQNVFKKTIAIQCPGGEFGLKDFAFTHDYNIELGESNSPKLNPASYIANGYKINYWDEIIQPELEAGKEIGEIKVFEKLCELGPFPSPNL